MLRSTAVCTMTRLRLCPARYSSDFIFKESERFSGSAVCVPALPVLQHPNNLPRPPRSEGGHPIEGALPRGLQYEMLFGLINELLLFFCFFS